MKYYILIKCLNVDLKKKNKVTQLVKDFFIEPAKINIKLLSLYFNRRDKH